MSFVELFSGLIILNIIIFTVGKYLEKKRKKEFKEWIDNDGLKDFFVQEIKKEEKKTGQKFFIYKFVNIMISDDGTCNVPTFTKITFPDISTAQYFVDVVQELMENRPEDVRTFIDNYEKIDKEKRLKYSLQE